MRALFCFLFHRRWHTQFYSDYNGIRWVGYYGCLRCYREWVRT